MEGPAWVDTHCHLGMIEGGDRARSRAAEAGVDALITIGVDLASSEEAVALAEALPRTWASVGIHPHDASTFDSEALVKLEELSGAQKVVGIGETGLDFYRDLSPREEQRVAFKGHIDLAKRTDLTLVIHMREAIDEVFGILEEGPPDRLVFHCFSGGPEDVERAASLGGFCSFAGNLTFASAGQLREAAAACPKDRLLIETDSPFLAPVPHRGRQNEPAYLPGLGSALAEVIGMPVESVARLTSENAERAFGISLSR